MYCTPQEMAKLYETGDFVIHLEPGKTMYNPQTCEELDPRQPPATISARMAEKANHFDLAPEFRRGIASGYLAETILTVSRLAFADQIRTDGLTHPPAQLSDDSSDFERE